MTAAECKGSFMAAFHCRSKMILYLPNTEYLHVDLA